MTRWLVAMVAALAMVAAFTRGGEARASAGDADELWMWTAPADAPDDAIATPSYIGKMASPGICDTIARGMTLWMRTQPSRSIGAFACRSPGAEP